MTSTLSGRSDRTSLFEAWICVGIIESGNVNGPNRIEPDWIGDGGLRCKRRGHKGEEAELGLEAWGRGVLSKSGYSGEEIGYNEADGKVTSEPSLCSLCFLVPPIVVDVSRSVYD